MPFGRSGFSSWHSRVTRGERSRCRSSKATFNFHSLLQGWLSYLLWISRQQLIPAELSRSCSCPNPTIESRTAAVIARAGALLLAANQLPAAFPSSVQLGGSGPSPRLLKLWQAFMFLQLNA